MCVVCQGRRCSRIRTRIEHCAPNIRVSEKSRLERLFLFFGLLKDFLEKFGLVVDSFGLWGLYGATTRAATLLAADRFVP